MTKLRRFIEWLRPRMPYLNIGLAVAAYWANEYCVQGFCQPVTWAAWVLGVSTAAFLLWPFAKKTPGLNYLLLFLMGVHFTVCVYCALFIGPQQLIATLVFFFSVLPLLVWVPVVFAVQALNRALTQPLPGARVVFGLGVVVLLAAQVWGELQYREIEVAVAQLPYSQRQEISALVRVVPRNYMAERLAGAYFKYHNYPEFVFDGWRPPLHDPLVNISLWRRGRWTWANGAMHEGNPLVVGGADEQAALYHQLFPDLPIKADCVCAQIYDGESYLRWKPSLSSHEADSTLRWRRAEFVK